jgi:nitrogen fixation protein FixH
MTTRTKQPYWIPGLFVGIMLAIVAVNGVMVYFATSTFPGLDSDKAYVNGLAYNETLKEAAASEALGWRTNTSLTTDRRLILDLGDQSGAPLSGLNLAGAMVRPATTSLDHKLSFAADPAKPGRYIADIAFPAEGLWEIRVAATARDGIVWQWNDRIMAP